MRRMRRKRRRRRRRRVFRDFAEGNKKVVKNCASGH